MKLRLAPVRLPISGGGAAMQRRTVKDVMTHNVVAVTEETSYKEIVPTLAQKLVSAVPVVDDGMVVLGIVSEADLLHKMQFSGLEPHVHLLERKQRRIARTKASGDIAHELMSSPAVTVSSGASLPAVAKMMDDERVKRLPVVDEQGRLVGIVSRSDLLRVYLRDDAAIRDEIRAHVLRRTLWIDPETITVAEAHVCGRRTARPATPAVAPAPRDPAPCVGAAPGRSPGEDRAKPSCSGTSSCSLCCSWLASRWPRRRGGRTAARRSCLR